MASGLEQLPVRPRYNEAHLRVPELQRAWVLGMTPLLIAVDVVCLIVLAACFGYRRGAGR